MSFQLYCILQNTPFLTPSLFDENFVKLQTFHVSHFLFFSFKTKYLSKEILHYHFDLPCPVQVSRSWVDRLAPHTVFMYKTVFLIYNVSSICNLFLLSMCV